MKKINLTLQDIDVRDVDDGDLIDFKQVIAMTIEGSVRTYHIEGDESKMFWLAHDLGLAGHHVTIS